MSEIDWKTAARLALELDGWRPIKSPLDSSRWWIKDDDACNPVKDLPDPLRWSVIIEMIRRGFADRKIKWTYDPVMRRNGVGIGPIIPANQWHSKLGKAALHACILAHGREMPTKEEDGD